MLRRAALLSSGLTSAGVVNGKIQDDWDTIIQIAKEGKASSYYKVGDKKSLSWGWQGTVDMILVGIDKDTRSDGLGKANMTWMASGPLAKKVFFDPSYGHKTCSSDGLNNNYKEAALSFYMEGLINLLPESVQKGIVRVKKTYSTQGANGVPSEADFKIWVPSIRELSPYWSNSVYNEAGETEGVIYSIDASWWSSELINGNERFWTRSWAEGGWSNSSLGNIVGAFIFRFYSGTSTNNQVRFTGDTDGWVAYNYVTISRYVLPCFCL